ncbi:MAG: hypothetical protein AAFU79_35535, partial [Myxococcota bacterium]
MNGDVRGLSSEPSRELTRPLTAGLLAIRHQEHRPPATLQRLCRLFHGGRERGVPRRFQSFDLVDDAFRGVGLGRKAEVDARAVAVLSG